MNARRRSATGVRRAWFVLLGAAVLAACGGGEGGSDAAGAGDEAGASAADAATAVAETPAAGSDTAAAGSDTAASVVQQCEPEPPTAASAGWTRFEHADGGFSFAHPAEWETLDPIQVTGAFDSTSQAEAGLPAGSRTALQVVRGPSGFPNVVVYRLPGVRSPVDTLYARHERRFRSLPQVVRVLGTGLTTCLAGEPARGLDFVFRQGEIDLATGEQSQGDETAYQRSWFAVRDGTLHHVQLLAADSSGLAGLDEVLRTWRWGGGSRAAALLDAAGGAAPGAVGAAGAENGTDGGAGQDTAGAAAGTAEAERNGADFAEAARHGETADNAGQ